MAVVWGDVLQFKLGRRIAQDAGDALCVPMVPPSPLPEVVAIVQNTTHSLGPDVYIVASPVSSFLLCDPKLRGLRGIHHVADFIREG